MVDQLKGALDPASLPEIPQLLQLTFTTAAAAVLLINAIPPFARRFIPYGKVAIDAAASASTSQKSAPPPPPPPTSTNPTSKFLDFLATLTVPHSWFGHFYIAGIIASLFWGYQISTHGCVFRWLAAHAGHSKMGIEQTLIVWLCFLAQVGRRAYEHYYIQKPGTSRMWFVHYLLGIAFYLLMSMAVWIEGTGAFRSP